MKNKRLISRVLLLVCSLILVCFSGFTLLACNDTRANSTEIFIDDFSGTYTISVKAKVKNHSTLPNATRSFEYGKGIEKLYECIIATPPYNQYVRIENNIIFIDLVGTGNRTYSCIIYPSKEKNTYIIDSMTYTLGEWAKHQAIFFPAFTLNKEINPYDNADTKYQCTYNINDLKTYYHERGYYTEIEDNKLKVICLLRYPSVFEGNDGEFGRKAISWSIIYENENTIRFSDAANQYVV